MESQRPERDMRTESASLGLCRLLAAWINGESLKAGDSPDFDALFQAADRHFLSAAACAALEDTGLMADCPPETTKRFQSAKLAAVRRTLLTDAEREKLLAFLEENGIWYMPLKGAALNGLYPRYGVRQFADTDILFDAARWKDVRDHMKRAGFAVISVRHGSDDVYHKPPVYNFEMHRRLFSADGRSDFLRVCGAYYADVERRLLPDEGRCFGFHFRDEDFYLYLLAHAYKHYEDVGTGLRTLLDLYLFRRSRPGMDVSYIRGELQKLGLEEFEALFRGLAEKLFGPAPCPELTEGERDMLAWVESSGVYGTTGHRVQGGLRKLQSGGSPATLRTKARYMFRRFFPDRDWYRDNAPFAYRHRWAMPFAWVYRFCWGVFVNWRRNLREATAVWSRRGE